MKKLLIVFLVVVVGAAASVSIVAARFEPRVRRNTLVGLIPVGGLSAEDAAKRLRIWWEGEKRNPLVLKNSLFAEQPPELKLSALGIALDDKASVAQLPMEDFWDTAKGAVAREEPAVTRFEPVFRSTEGGLAPLKKMVEAAIGGRRPAKAYYHEGAIERQPEVSGQTLDQAKFVTAFVDAVTKETALEVPLTEAPKKVPDEELAKITDLVSEFSTRFPRSKISRNSNIRTASGKLNGVVLAPGEQFSFNQTVGRRTIENGFKIAGVYKNGKHDLGIGGGICQVSSTLYNAVLLANLKVLRRQNHSMPVAYLPVGRDATVDYGGIDLVFENTLDTPVAISSSYAPGALTFRILGRKDPSITVKIVATGHRSWDNGIKTVNDPNLPAGKRKVVEKGSRGHSVTTYRLVFRDGVQIARELLGHSYYRGGVRIVAVNKKAPATPKPVAPPTSAPGETIPPEQPSAGG